MSLAENKVQSIPELPPLFLERMRSFLGDEYNAFISSYDLPPQTGLRVNLLKISPTQFVEISPCKLDPIPWSTSGYYLLDYDNYQYSPGKHPYHAAGLYYLQEPSAMLVAEILAPQPGERILDLSAAPGGKATHIASLMQNKGLFVANEIHPKRVWDLAENLERWGVRNTVITNETPENLVEHFGPYFDRVLVDAPCSGEGLFRKAPDARVNWTPKLIEGCSVRQANILHAAARLVRSGGLLVYSTCTFAPEENEGTLDRFLDTHPEFKIVDLPHTPGSDPGHPEWLPVPGDASLKATHRLWPHHVRGEGHFAAILQKNTEDKIRVFIPQPKVKNPQSIPLLFQTFTSENSITFSEAKKLYLTGSYLYAKDEDWPDFGSLRVIHAGWWLGTIKKNRFEPAHALAMGLAIQDIHKYINLTSQESDLQKYLRGETITARDFSTGWVVVLVDGFPIGWGKSVQGEIKNAYPRGLRWF
jgi:NOL1/NOP2/sun family putative RNA methylase